MKMNAAQRAEAEASMVIALGGRPIASPLLGVPISQATPPTPTPKPAHAGPPATPLVRSLAAELGVSLDQVKGSGIGGRIRARDVHDAAIKHSDALLEAVLDQMGLNN